jgi:hypothetical protein
MIAPVGPCPGKSMRGGLIEARIEMDLRLRARAEGGLAVMGKASRSEWRYAARWTSARNSRDETIDRIAASLPSMVGCRSPIWAAGSAQRTDGREQAAA